MLKVSKENFSPHTQLPSFIFDCQSSSLRVLICSINITHSMHHYPRVWWCWRGKLTDPSLPFHPALCSPVQPFAGKQCHPQIYTLALHSEYASLGLGTMLFDQAMHIFVPRIHILPQTSLEGQRGLRPNQHGHGSGPTCGASVTTGIDCNVSTDHHCITTCNERQEVVIITTKSWVDEALSLT